jgi:hypothetical protein
MGDRKQAISAIVLSLLLLSTGFGSFAFVDATKWDGYTTEIIHLGYLQLAAHDFFDMNRVTETDNENGKLDLSTVLFNPQAGLCDFEKALNEEDGCELYDDQTIANGGEKRSVENIMISTASAEVGEKYLEDVAMHGGEIAYENALTFYHENIEQAYEDSFHLEFPEPREGSTTNLHNLAVRAGHDFLPAEIMYKGELTSLFAIFPLGDKLTEEEQGQPSSPVDGEFDIEFTGIDFCPVPPNFCIQVDLLEADQSFGGQFKETHMNKNTFDKFMHELSDGKFNENDRVSILLDEAFAFGINLD